MKHIVKLDEDYAIFKTYENGDIKFARVIARTTDLKEAMKLAEDVGMGGGGCSPVPVNNVGQGNIAGLDIGLRKKKKSKKWTSSLTLSRS